MKVTVLSYACFLDSQGRSGSLLWGSMHRDSVSEGPSCSPVEHALWRPPDIYNLLHPP